jgi:prepilin-type N-terminal cleavage/methylation domain-containing protein
MKPHKILSKGFTLIELAVALTIVALVIGGLAVPMSKRIAEQQYVDTQANIDKAMDAIVGYAILNRRLPCPDVNTAATPAPDNRDGFEDIAGAVGAITGCSIGVAGTPATAVNYHSDPDGVSWGDLPWQTLGLAAPNNVDAWNNRLRYVVFTPLVTQVAPSVTCSNLPTAPTIGIGFQNMGCNTAIANTTIAGGGQIDIRCGNPTTTTASTAALGCLSTPAAAPYQVTQNAVVVVYSMGANGFGATSMVNLSSISSNAFTAARIAKVPDEASNAPELDSGATQALASAARRQYVARSRTDDSSASGAFDDVVSFMSAATLAAKLSTAGVWP